MTTPTPAPVNDSLGVSSLKWVDTVVFYEKYKVPVSLILAFLLSTMVFSGILLKLNLRPKESRARVKASENRYRTLLEAVPDIVLQVDRSGGIAWANTVGHEFFGGIHSIRECFSDESETEACLTQVAPLFAWSQETVCRLKLYERTGNRHVPQQGPGKQGVACPDTG